MESKPYTSVSEQIGKKTNFLTSKLKYNSSKLFSDTDIYREYVKFYHSFHFINDLDEMDEFLTIKMLFKMYSHELSIRPF
jgi:hypothetical protein